VQVRKPRELSVQISAVSIMGVTTTFMIQGQVVEVKGEVLELAAKISALQTTLAELMGVLVVARSHRRVRHVQMEPTWLQAGCKMAATWLQKREQQQLRKI
jgi:hypothetical protein